MANAALSAAEAKWRCFTRRGQAREEEEERKKKEGGKKSAGNSSPGVIRGD